MNNDLESAELKNKARWMRAIRTDETSRQKSPWNKRNVKKMKRNKIKMRKENWKKTSETRKMRKETKKGRR